MEKSINELLKIHLPELPEKSLFAIGQTESNENVISNYYAFFLDQNENHKLGSIFLDSLIELLNVKGASLSKDWDDCSIIREAWLNKKSRVDFKIEKGNKKNKKIIIIESKITAKIYNDLELYWNSLKNIADENKTAVILTLQRVERDYPNFINITHEEWMRIVFEKLKSIKTMSFYKIFALQLCELFYVSDERKKILNERNDIILKNKEDIATLKNSTKEQLSIMDNKDMKKINELKVLYSTYHETYYLALKRNITDLSFDIISFKQRKSFFQIKFDAFGFVFNLEFDFNYEDKNSFLTCCLLFDDSKSYYNMNPANLFKILKTKSFINYLENSNFKVTNDSYEGNGKYIVTWKNYTSNEFIENKNELILIDFINNDFILVLNKIEQLVIKKQK